jgi:hypothetical protein
MTKIIDRLSQDLLWEFPGVEGFSPRNLKYMRAFAQAWPNEPIVQHLATQISWFDHCVLLDKVKSQPERQWYVHKTVENGWRRSVLVHWIESGLYERQGKAQTDFQRTLATPQSDLAREKLRDPLRVTGTSRVSPASVRQPTTRQDLGFARLVII